MVEAVEVNFVQKATTIAWDLAMVIEEVPRYVNEKMSPVESWRTEHATSV